MKKKYCTPSVTTEVVEIGVFGDYRYDEQVMVYQSEGQWTFFTPCCGGAGE